MKTRFFASSTSMPAMCSGNIIVSCYALLLAAIVGLATAHAATITWDGGAWMAGTGGNGTAWGTAANWRGDVAPVSGDSIQFVGADFQTNNTSTTTEGSNVVLVPNGGTSTLQVGQLISGGSIPAGAYITSIVNSTTVTISQPATATSSAVYVTVPNVGGLAGTPTLALGASRVIDSLNFGNSNTFTLGSAADISSGYTLTLSNVMRTGGGTVTIAANVNLASNATGKSTWRDTGNGTTTVTGPVGSASSIIFNRSGTNGVLALNGANTFMGSLVVDGSTLSLGGTNAYVGTTTVSGGTLQLNFGASAAPTSDIINASSGLVAGGVRGGGTVTATGKNSTAVSQTFNGLTINSGATTFNITNGNSGGSTKVNLGAITRGTPGGTVNFVQPTTNTTIGSTNGYVTSTANDASGILGAYATVGGTDWATNNGTNIVAYTGYTTLAGDTPSIIDGATTNVSITNGSTGVVGQAGGTVTVNTIRANDAAARTMTVGTGNILRLGAVGGILSTGAGGLTVGASGNAGTLTAGGSDNTAGELILNNSTALTVNSVITDNGAGSVALTKSGSGTATLVTNSAYTGGTTVNAGTLAVTAGTTNPFSTTGGITVAGGTLSLGAGTAQTTSGAVVLGGGTISGGTLTKSGANYDLRHGTITTTLAGSAGIDKTTSGAVTLNNTTANTFTGVTTITEGSITGSSSNVISISGDLIVGSVTGGNAASFAGSGNNSNFNRSKNITVHSNGAVSFGNGASQNLDGTITILGGTFSGQVYQNSTVNMTGGTWGATSYGNIQSFNISASADTAVVSGYSAGNQSTKTFTVADGAAVIDLLFSSGTAGNGSNVAKAGPGLMLATGAKGYTGYTTINGGTFVTNSLLNGGVASGIGASSNAADRLLIGNDTIFRYTGAATSTDRLFTVNGSSAGHSATLESSGSGAVDFTGTGNIAWGTTNQTRTLKLGGTNTGDNRLTAVIANNGTTTNVVSVTKQDAGKWILAGTNTYTGATTVNGGLLFVSGSLGTSAVTINAGGTLGASGSLGGSVTVNNGGTLANFTTIAGGVTVNSGGLLNGAGSITGALTNSGALDLAGSNVGLLTASSFTLGSASTTTLQIASRNGGTAVAGTHFDQISVSGAISFAGTLNIDTTGLSSLADGDSFSLFVSSSDVYNTGLTSVTMTGAYAPVMVGDLIWGTWTGVFGGQQFTFDEATGILSVSGNSAVPEPSTYALLGGVMILAFAVGRSRKRA